MGLGGNPAARPAYDRGVRENGFGQPIGAPVADWGGAQPISPVTLTGTHVRLEPLTDAHAEVLYDPLVTESDPRDWTYLFGEPGLDRRQFADYVGRLQRTPASLPMAILSTAGAGLGIAAYLRIDPAMGSAEVGSILYAAALQRTTGATEAMALMARHVFDDLGYRRYEWKCDSLNAPSRAAATRLGFRYEGRFRNAVVYKGRNRDTDWFAMTDGDWPGVKAAYAAWLDPENFEPDGAQRRSLAELLGHF
jgi:RimJ/RimL family protein N-acetyltransferase